LCCAQAPSPKAVTRTATTMIVFNSFNLNRLLSLQVAPVCLGRSQRGSNAFLNFFGCITNREPNLFRVSGRSRACGHGLFLLSASTEAQSSGQNGHDHDGSYNFQCVSPPFAASCRYPFRLHGKQRISYGLWMYARRIWFFLYATGLGRAEPAISCLDCDRRPLVYQIE
jgi:hypothetical protein